MAVDVEVRSVAVHPLAHPIRQPAYSENVAGGVQSQRIDIGQPLSGQNLILNRMEAGVVGLKRVDVGHRLYDTPAVGIRSPRDATSAIPLSSNSKQQIGADEREKHNGDYAIHREERRVQLAQVVMPHQGVLVGQERGHDNYSYRSQLTQSKDQHEGDQQAEHRKMKNARKPQRGMDSQVPRKRVQSMAS